MLCAKGAEVARIVGNVGNVGNVDNTFLVGAFSGRGYQVRGPCGQCGHRVLSLSKLSTIILV
jgi:hypothetical protein